MSAAKLVTYLIELSAYETRIEFARQILAKNMNFSPAWILAIIHKYDTQQTDQIKIKHFDSLLQIIGLDVSNQDIISLYQYFDYQRNGKITNKQFIELLLPQNNQALRNGVIKRIAQDLLFSFDLKYALKRLFTEIIQAQSRIKSYEGAFLLKAKDKNNYKQIKPQELKKFLNTFGKYPSDSELMLLIKTINSGRCKQVDTKIVQQIMTAGLKDIQQLSKIPPVLLDVDAIPSMPRQDTSPIKRFSPMKGKTTPNRNQLNKRGNNQQEYNIPSSPLKIMRTTSILQPVDNFNNGIPEDTYNSPIKQKHKTAQFSNQRFYQPKIKNEGAENTTAIKRYSQQSTPFNRIRTNQIMLDKNQNKIVPNYQYGLLKQHKPSQISSYQRRNMLWTPNNKTPYSDLQLLRLRNQEMEKQIQLNKCKNKIRMHQIKGERNLMDRR